MKVFLEEISREIRESEKKDKSEEEIRKKYKEIVKKYGLDFERARALIVYHFEAEDKWIKIATQLSSSVNRIKLQIRREIEGKLLHLQYLHSEAEEIISKMLKEITSKVLNECYLEKEIYKDSEKVIEILEKEIEILKDFEVTEYIVKRLQDII